MNNAAYRERYISPVPDRYAEVPPGVVPVNLLTDQQMIGLGLDPTEVRRLEDELSQMGLGLGISIGGIFRGIKKGVTGVAKGVFKAGKFAVTKAVPFAVTRGLPVAAGAALAIKFGPKVIGAAAKMFKKRPEQVTETEARTAQEAAVRAANGRPAIAPAMVDEPRPRPSGESILTRIKDVVTPLIPQVIERVTAPAAIPVPEVALPPSVAPAVTSPPVVVQAGAAPAAPATGGFDPKLLLMALPLLFMGGRR